MVSSLNRLLRSAQTFVKNNAPALLTGAGIVCGVIAAVQVGQSTPKALELRKELEQENSDATRGEVFINVAPAYIKPAALGALSVGLICAGSTISKRRQASLASAYVMLSEAYANYRKEVLELIDTDTAKELNQQIVNTQYEVKKSDGDIDTRQNEEMFYDGYTNSFFMSTMADVIAAEYETNRMLAIAGQVSLNEFYDYLDQPPVAGGDMIGWTVDDNMNNLFGYYWIDFENQPMSMNDGTKCISIEYLQPLCPFVE